MNDWSSIRTEYRNPYRQVYHVFLNYMLKTRYHVSLSTTLFQHFLRRILLYQIQNNHFRPVPCIRKFSRKQSPYVSAILSAGIGLEVCVPGGIVWCELRMENTTTQGDDFACKCMQINLCERGEKYLKEVPIEASYLTQQKTPQCLKKMCSFYIEEFRSISL